MISSFRFVLSQALASLLFIVLIPFQSRAQAPTAGSSSPLRLPEYVDPVGDSFRPSMLLPLVSRGVFENLPNRRSNAEIFFSNYGMFGTDTLPDARLPGGYWPRGSGDGYFHGGGIWFGAKKVFRDAQQGSHVKKMSVVGYNPLTGASWMVPGLIGDNWRDSRVDYSADGINNYRLYSSTDYTLSTGKPTDPDEQAKGGASWPVWDTDPGRVLGEEHYFGNYVAMPMNRTNARYPGGPAIISDEDLFCVFKETDLSRYETGEEAARQAGYPLGIQFEQSVYSWGSGALQNVVIIRYRMINRSSDTLYECWAASVIDIDIGRGGNDRTKAVILDAREDSLNLGVAWSNAEDQKTYGYFGCDILESPAVDASGFLRKDNVVFPGAEQLGMATFRNWVIDIDPATPEERYDFMAAKTLDDDNGPGDKRMLSATGPFNMLPGDTAVMAVALLFAPGAGNDPLKRGEWEDLARLLELDSIAQTVYDSVKMTSDVQEERGGWRLPMRLDLQ